MPPSDLYTITIAGLQCHVYNHASALAQNLPIGVLVATHGRGGSQSDLKDICDGAIQRAKTGSTSGGARRALIVVTLDQRNHGTRLLEPNGNEAFDKNANHVADMWSIYRGTAADISGLMDVLPAFLFPKDERVVEEFFVLGVSLGGHVTWVSLLTDPRVKIGIPIIGCPDYISLMTARISTFTSSAKFVPSSAPNFPASLKSTIAKKDPCAAPYTSKDPKENPFFGKKILILCGKDDTLVPAKFTQPMFEAMEVGHKGRKEMVIETGAGHEVTKEMIRLVGEWIWEQGLAKAQDSSL